MILLNPKHHKRSYPDERSREIMIKTIAFLEKKGLRKMIKAPVPDEDKFERIWKKHVYPLRGQYTMNS